MNFDKESNSKKFFFFEGGRVRGGVGWRWAEGGDGGEQQEEVRPIKK